MMFEFRKLPNDSPWPYRIIDGNGDDNSGKPRLIVACDTETGECHRLVRDANGKFFVDPVTKRVATEVVYLKPPLRIVDGRGCDVETSSAGCRSKTMKLVKVDPITGEYVAAEPGDIPPIDSVNATGRLGKGQPCTVKFDPATGTWIAEGEYTPAQLARMAWEAAQRATPDVVVDP